MSGTPTAVLADITSLQRLLERTERRAAVVRLCAAAALTAGVYVLMLAVPYPLLSWYDVPLLDLGKLAGFGKLQAVALGCGYVLVFVCYLEAYRMASRLSGGPAVAVVIGSGILFSFILLWVYPVGAADIYDYIFRARLWGFYDYNPLTVTPLQVNTDPWFPYVVWVWFTSPYGPLWADLSFVIYRLAGNSLLVNLLLFKLLAVCCAAAASILLFDMLRERGAGVALSGALLFAWNPLLLFETAVNGHNDTLMLALLVAGLWLYRRQRLWAALALAMFAALVKIAALAALPLLLVAGAARMSGRKDTSVARVLALGVAWCMLVAALVYAPLWHGTETFGGLLALDNRFTASPAAVIKLALEQGIGREPAEWFIRNLFAALFLGAYLLLLRRARNEHDKLPEMMFGIIVLLTLATLWFQPWYLIWLVGLAPLMKEKWRRLAVIWSAGALSVYLLFDFAWYWFADFFNAANELVLNVSVVGLWLGPPTLWLFFQKARSIRTPLQR